jgi:hypothetical protein
MPFTFYDQDGTEIEVQTRSFADNEFVQFDNWLRQVYLERALTAASNLPARQKEDVYELALKQSMELHIFDRGTGSKIMSSIGGLAQAFKLSLVDHNALSIEKLRMLMLDRNNRTRAQAHWVKLNLGDVKGAAKKPGEFENHSPDEKETKSESPDSSSSQS